MTTKFYKNPQRERAQAQEAAYKPYVPQYQLRGLTPEDFASTPGTQTMGTPKFNNKQGVLLIKGTPDMTQSQPVLRQDAPIGRNVPFAEVAAPAKHLGIPNVGNNIENTWAGIDGDIIDDIGLSEYSGTRKMLDNNDYVDIESMAMQTPSISVPEEIPSPGIDLQDDEYLVAIDDTIIATGSLDMIQQEVRELIFGDHALCDGQQIPVEDIIVLKRIKIRVGVFVDG